jgi:hypothetical protein
MTAQQFLKITKRKQLSLIAGACNDAPVRGLTHGFYKYPARFSPAFVRSTIEAFTEPNDLVIDPHVGGGTSLVEALATGRDAIGVDISALASFVTGVKTTVFSDAELGRLRAWSEWVADSIDIKKSSIQFAEYAELGYYKHLNQSSRWRLRKAIEQGLGSAIGLGSPRLEAFGRCVTLRSAQWALDGRAKLPSFGEFREFFKAAATQMIAGASALRAAVRQNAPHRPSIQIINRSAAGLEYDKRLKRRKPPRLVVTSPPYPGVHVLYHRFQVDGRKETSLPFMIAGKLDGAGSSYYTMGDRKYPELATYFANIKATMSSVVALADEYTVFVQMIAFSEPTWQLQRYLQAMEEVGLTEVFLPALKKKGDGRIWRRVPGRRWYSDQQGATPGSQEVVLFHRRAF